VRWFLSIALVVLVLLVVLILGLVALASIALHILDATPAIIDDLAKAVTAIETRTEWSYDQATDFVLFAVTLVLVIESRALTGLANFLKTGAAIFLGFLTGSRPPVERERGTIRKFRWVVVPVFVWGVSIAIVHAFA
jgi:hypothetical protein